MHSTVCLHSPNSSVAGLQRFQAALEAHKHWPTDELAALLVGVPLHAPPARAGTSLAAAPPQPLAAEGSQAAPSAEGSTASQAEAGGRGSSTGAGIIGGEGGSHLREHIEAGLGCLQAAVRQGQLNRQAILQVGGRRGRWAEMGNTIAVPNACDSRLTYSAAISQAWRLSNAAAPPPRPSTHCPAGCARAQHCTTAGGSWRGARRLAGAGPQPPCCRPRTTGRLFDGQQPFGPAHQPLLLRLHAPVQRGSVSASGMLVVVVVLRGGTACLLQNRSIAPVCRCAADTHTLHDQEHHCHPPLAGHYV